MLLQTMINKFAIDIKICNESVKIVETEVHLGNVLSTNGSIIDFSNIINDMQARSVSIVNNFNNLSFKSKAKIFSSQCESLYGCQLWDMSDNKINKLYTTWRKCIRYVLNLSYRTKSYLLPNLVESVNLVDTIMQRQICFYLNILNHKSKTISNVIKNSLSSYSSYVVRNVNMFLDKFKITLVDLINFNNPSVKRLVLQAQTPLDWRGGLVEELLHARDGVVNLEITNEEINIMLNDVCCT